MIRVQFGIKFVNRATPQSSDAWWYWVLRVWEGRKDWGEGGREREREGGREERERGRGGEGNWMDSSTPYRASHWVLRIRCGYTVNIPDPLRRTKSGHAYMHLFTFPSCLATHVYDLYQYTCIDYRDKTWKLFQRWISHRLPQVAVKNKHRLHSFQMIIIVMTTWIVVYVQCMYTLYIEHVRVALCLPYDQLWVQLG